MELSTFRILYGYNNAKTRRWMFAFFLIAEMVIFRLVYLSEKF